VVFAHLSLNYGITLYVIMDTASVQEYVESAKPVIKDSPQMGEATTKAALLRDFIELLGWEIPMNTELEYSVNAFGKVFKVDYALVLDGRPVAFLEAKGLDTTLTSDHREQLSEYMRSEDVNWGILTNGQEYEFYQRRVIDTNVKVDAVEQTTLQQLSNKDSIIEAYCVEAIREQESGPIIEHIRELRDTWETLTSEKDELATAVVDTLTESISDAVEPEAKSQAKEMIDRLIADIESEIDTDAVSQAGGTPVSGGSTEDSPTLSGSYSVEIVQNGDVIETFEDSVQSDLIASVVGHLIQNYELISAVQPLPYIPAEKRAIIHDTPTYNGTEMAQPRELEEGYYLEVNLSWSQKKREIERLAEACGVEVIIEE
jgi:Mg2+ and Co2+ transporter CorA